MSITLGERRVWKGRGLKRKCVVKEDTMMYVPFWATLQSLLRNQAILAMVSYTCTISIGIGTFIILLSNGILRFLLQVESGHKSESGFLEDFCDGEFFSAHPLFSVHASALQCFFYFDEVEVCNPLGSKAKIHIHSLFKRVALLDGAVDSV